MEQQYYAKRLMDYAGKSLYPGQVMTLGGHLNDEKLVRLGLLTKYDGSERDLVLCGQCGAQFINHNYRIGHFKLNHSELTDEEEDRAIDQLEKRYEQDELITVA